MTKESIASGYQALQEKICSDLEKLDGKSSFSFDHWERAEGGGGLTRVIKEGDLLVRIDFNLGARLSNSSKNRIQGLALLALDKYNIKIIL